MKTELLGWEINGENENGWIGRYIDVSATGVGGAKTDARLQTLAPRSSSCSSE